MSDDPTEADASPPADAVRAVRLIVAGIAVSIVETILTVTDRDSLKRQILQNDPNVRDIDTLVDIAVVSGVLTGIAAAVLWIRLAVTIRKGRNWTRTVSVALAGAAVLLTVAALTDLPSALDAMLSVARGLLIVAVIVLLAIRLFVRQR